MKRAAKWAAIGLAGLAVFGGPALAQKGTGRAAAKLKIGQSIVLREGDSSVRMRFTLLRYLDPVHSPYYRPYRGTKFVAFRLRITNLTRRRWQGTLASWAELVATNGEIYDVTSSLRSVAQPWPLLAPTLNNGTTIEPRETLVGYLGWVLPRGIRLKEFRYRLELGPDTGDWMLRRI